PGPHDPDGTAARRPPRAGRSPPARAGHPARAPGDADAGALKSRPPKAGLDAEARTPKACTHADHSCVRQLVDSTICPPAFSDTACAFSPVPVKIGDTMYGPQLAATVLAGSPGAGP